MERSSAKNGSYSIEALNLGGRGRAAAGCSMSTVPWGSEYTTAESANRPSWSMAIWR